MGGIKHQIIWSVFSIASIESHMGIYIHVFPIIRWLYEHGIYPHMTYAFFDFFLLKQPVVFHTARDPRCQPEIEKLAGSGQWGGWNKCWQPNPEQTYIHTHTYIYINIYLYIYSIPTPLKNMSSSAGIMKFPTEWKNKTCSKPPTTYIYMYMCIHIYIYIYININQTITIWLWLNGFVLECPDINRDINLDTHTLKTHSLQFKKTMSGGYLRLVAWPWNLL